ncbi:MAG: helix-turn-helix transcriptional regulator [Anaerolineaceae bacterium]|nr:helix-turn-helix transcriptional regulator [Anaerolineaceae bacterium]
MQKNPEFKVPEFPANETITEVFGKSIRLLRKEKEISQDKLGEIIGVSQPTIASWENNVKEASCPYIYKIAKTFGVTTDFLFGSTQKYPDKLFQDTGLTVEAIQTLTDIQQYAPIDAIKQTASAIIASPHFVDLVYAYLILCSLCETIEEDMKDSTKTVDDLQGYIKLLKLGKYDLVDHCFNILCDISSAEQLIDKAEKSIHDIMQRENNI